MKGVLGVSVILRPGLRTRIEWRNIAALVIIPPDGILKRIQAYYGAKVEYYKTNAPRQEVKRAMETVQEAFASVEIKSVAILLGSRLESQLRIRISSMRHGLG